MKKTTSSRKQREEREILSYNIRLALSKFTAILMEEPDEYKTTDGCINYYPSDCLDNWQYSIINANGERINEPENAPSEAAGVICTGAHYCDDDPQVVKIMFNDL